MKKKTSFLALVFSIILFASFYQSTEFTDPFIMPKNFFLVFSGCFFIAVMVAYFFIQKYKLSYNINLVDISVGGFVLYNILHFIIQGGNPLQELKLITIFVLAVIYYILKLVLNPDHALNKEKKFLNTIVVVLLLIGLIQAMLGIGQYIGVIENLQKEFRLGGAFGNPGPLANYLVALLPFSLIYAVYTPKGRLKYLAIASSLFILIALPLTAARTAWIAAIVVLLYVVLHSKPLVSVWNKYFLTWKNKLILFAVAATLLIGGAYALSSIKQDSASGRLFIWKVSLEMIKDKPVFGHGYSSYAAVHNNYQANYFRENPEDWDNAFLADGINYAFNEFIHMASEVGVVGLLIFLLIPFLIFKDKKLNRPEDKSLHLVAAEGAILAILVSSIFSYPLQGVPVLSILFLSFALHSANSTEVRFSIQTNAKQRKFFAMAAFVILIALVQMTLTRFKTEKEWLKAFHLVRQNKYPEAQERYAEMHETMKYNQFFLFNYGAELSVMGQNKQSIEILKTVEHRLNDSDFYIYLGNSYEGIGRLEKALECFDQASYIMPVKHFPGYRKFLIYQKLGEFEKATVMAQYLYDMPVKVESDIVTNIKNEVSLFLAGAK